MEGSGSSEQIIRYGSGRPKTYGSYGSGSVTLLYDIFTKITKDQSAFQLQTNQKVADVPNSKGDDLG
jgi:hypothetical protein